MAPSVPVAASTCHSRSLGVDSKPVLKSTKQQHCIRAKDNKYGNGQSPAQWDMHLNRWSASLLDSSDFCIPHTAVPLWGPPARCGRTRSSMTFIAYLTGSGHMA